MNQFTSPRQPDHLCGKADFRRIQVHVTAEQCLGGDRTSASRLRLCRPSAARLLENVRGRVTAPAASWRGQERRGRLSDPSRSTRILCDHRPMAVSPPVHKRTYASLLAGRLGWFGVQSTNYSPRTVSSQDAMSTSHVGTSPSQRLMAEHAGVIRLVPASGQQSSDG